MKRILLSLFFTISFTFVFAQAVPDASFTDCNSNTKSVYQSLAAGKVLVVANAGTNCGICQSHASSVASLANANPSTIEVWGSITTKTGGNPGCSAVASWVSTYGWTNVFSFLDSNKYWFVAATPRYTVIDPADSTIAYVGGSWTTAESTALQLANSIGLNELPLVQNISISNNIIRLNLNEGATNGQIKMYDITGALLEKWQFSREGKSIDLPIGPNIKRGIYLLHITINGKTDVKKVMF